MKYSDYKIHHFADAFPLIKGDDFDRFVANVSQHGQREPIVRKAGVIIDGRNRLRACLMLGLEPTFEEFDDSMDVYDYIWLKNDARRHLTDDVRAQLATRMANHVREEARKRVLEGAHAGPAVRDGEIIPPPKPAGGSGDTREILARKAGVSRYKIENALKVKKHDEEHGTSLSHQVEAGEITLSAAAKIAEGKDATPELPREQRAPRIRELSAAGFRAAQIAEELHLTEGMVRRVAKEEKIELPDARIGKTHRVDVTRVLSETVGMMTAFGPNVDLIVERVADIPADEPISEYISRLGDALRAVKRLKKTLEDL